MLSMIASSRSLCTSGIAAQVRCFDPAVLEPRRGSGSIPSAATVCKEVWRTRAEQGRAGHGRHSRAQPPYSRASSGRSVAATEWPWNIHRWPLLHAERHCLQGWTMWYPTALPLRVQGCRAGGAGPGCGGAMAVRHGGMRQGGATGGATARTASGFPRVGARSKAGVRNKAGAGGGGVAGDGQAGASRLAGAQLCSIAAAAQTEATSQIAALLTIPGRRRR